MPSRPVRAVTPAADVGDDTGRAGATGPRRGARHLARGGCLLLAGAGLFTLYLRQSRVAPFNSDGASIILQANSMLHGNPVLSGWWTADVSFYTTELPEYVLVEVFRGLRPDVVHICGALTYTLTVLLAALLARGRATGRAGVARALLAGGLMLAPGVVGGTQALLENPDHLGTAVPILTMLLLVDCAPERWYVPAAVCGLLAWTQVADQLTLVAAIAPVAVVAVVRLRALAVRRRPRRELRYDAMLLAAAIVSAGIGWAAGALIRVSGGFRQSPLVYGLLSPVARIPANTRVLGQSLLLLFGANNPGHANPGGTRQVLATIAVFHWIGLAVAAAGFAVAVAVFFTSQADRVTQIVVAGTLATLAAGVFGTVLPSLANAHEIAIVLPFGAVLAGRMLPPRIPGRWRTSRPAAPALAAWLAAGLAALCFAASQPPIVSPDQELATWLLSHRYTDGLAGYWQASITTVTSGGKVLVSPIDYQAAQAWHWYSSATWYDPGRRRANFIVAVTDPSPGQGGLSTATVRRSFGPPVRQYQIGTYVVMVYDYNLLTRLTGATRGRTG